MSQQQQGSLAQPMQPLPEAGPESQSFIETASKASKSNPRYSWLLIQKNIILTIKNPKNLIFLIIAPFLLSLFLYGFQSLADDAGKKSWINNPRTNLANVSLKCIGDNCTSLIYRTIVNGSTVNKEPDWVKHTIQYIKANSDIDSVSKIGYIQTSADLKSQRDLLVKYPNQTQVGIFFCVDSSVPEFMCGTAKYNYYIFLNKTDSFQAIFAAPSVPLPVDYKVAALKNLIDNAILDYETKDKPVHPRTNYEYTQYPIVPNRFLQGFDMITQAGAFYYMITPLFAFLFIQNEIVREKEFRLRQGLNVFGATHFSYWLSWFVVSILYSLIASLSTIAAGLAFQFHFFLDTPFFVILAIMFPFCLALQMLSYFLSTLAPTLKAANSISYGLVLFAIVVESFVANDALLMFIFADEASALIKTLKYVLMFYPPFAYTKVFTSITNYSGNHFDFVTNKWEVGPGYTWSLFTEQRHGNLFSASSTYTMYSSLVSMLLLYMNVVFFGVLTWYFDNVIQANRGTGRPFYFLFQPSYWGFGANKRRVRITVDDLRNPTYNIRDEEESVTKERLRVMRNSNNREPVLGMRIKGLSKTFQTMCSKNRVEAIKSLSLQIEPNELMSILGHNGAGKTTLINILTGIIAPDPSEELQIMINNYSITRISEIRRHIGVCPQFDILWKELTAEEHLTLFGKLKGIPSDEIDSKINQILKFVSLDKEKKSRVATFSGGMKRRLSLAVAAIGSPKIIFLDEPTTGLDPKVRQQVWTLIERLKKRKSVVLTTHSMEEADILSDRISILVKGKLKCIGTSMYLKDRYGSGYRIALNVVEGKSEQAMRYIRKLFPEAVQVDSNGGNLLVGLQQYQSLIEFVKMLQSRQANGLDEYSLKQSIKDWNVSHTTLQEVFMKVTKESTE